MPTTAELKADMEHYKAVYEEAIEKYVRARVAESPYKLGDVYTNGRLKGKIVKFGFRLPLDYEEPIVRIVKRDGTMSNREMLIHSGWRKVGVFINGDQEDEL